MRLERGLVFRSRNCGYSRGAVGFSKRFSGTRAGSMGGFSRGAQKDNPYSDTTAVEYPRGERKNTSLRERYYSKEMLEKYRS